MEFRFLTLKDVLELHDMQLESYGGAPVYASKAYWNLL